MESGIRLCSLVPVFLFSEYDDLYLKDLFKEEKKVFTSLSPLIHLPICSLRKYIYPKHPGIPGKSETLSQAFARFFKYYS